MRGFLFAALSIAAPAHQIHAQPIQMKVVDEDVVHARLAAFSTRNSERELTIRKLFVAAGCAETSISTVRVPHVKESDIVCTLPGQTESQIVVGGHFDMVDKGSGVVDNWSGASMLSSLYEGLAVTPRKHTFVFIGFSGEEKGLLGSHEYVRLLRKDTAKIRAMINFDTLGLADTEVWVNRADPKLVSLLEGVANYMKLPVSGMNVDKVGSSDSESFREVHVPAMTIHSIKPETWRILHSPDDQLNKIDFAAYYRTYRLMLAYLAFLDQKLD
jgi:Zn-dependent M28 family amino/carboxypeptidase